MASQPQIAIDPPVSLRGILGRLGPGLIIAAMIVGSGELVVTTKTGAEAGFWLLWLIVLGCVIKVFAQVEFGRYAISTGKATVEAMNEVPGPRLHVSWLLWYWLVMFAVSWGQLGGIVGAVGQSLAMSIPLTGDFNRLLDEQDQWDQQARAVREHLRQVQLQDLHSRDPAVRKAAAQRLRSAVETQLGQPRPAYRTKDDLYWAIVVTAVTVALLVNGRYTMVQNVSALLVGGFLSHLVKNSSRDKEVAEKRHNKGMLISSGFIAGGALMGIVLAVLKLAKLDHYVSLGIPMVLENGKWVDGTPAGWFSQYGEFISLVAFILLVGFVYWQSRKEK